MGTEDNKAKILEACKKAYDAYPVVWCGGGSLGRSNGNKTVGEVWARSDRDNVKYFTDKNF